MQDARKIEWAETGDPGALGLLRGHPFVGEVREVPDVALRFCTNGRVREIVLAGPADVRGVVEIIDNNPLACADRFAVPDPVGTLLLLALAPLGPSGLLSETPAALANRECDIAIVEDFAKDFSLDQGIAFAAQPIDLGSIVIVTLIAALNAPTSQAEIEELYETHLGRSFLVRRSEGLDWDPKRLAGSPEALYRLRWAPGDGDGLLTAQLMGDERGKCGAAHWIQAMNVMAGLEETAGLFV